MVIKEENGAVIVTPSGKLDTISAPDFNQALLEVLSKKPKVCIVDLSNISFLSSSGLQALLVGAKTSKNSEIAFKICGMNKMVEDVFILSGFDKFIDFYSDVQSALKDEMS